MRKFDINLLLAEDDDTLGPLLKEYLTAKGYNVELFTDGESALSAINTGMFNICLLDIMLPQKSGLKVAEEVRKLNFEIPIVFLTAKTIKEDIIEGFKVGADDYITKPFSMEELIYRLEAILRRCSAFKSDTKQTVFNIGSFVFNSNEQRLTRNNKVIKLTTKESELLKLLCENTNSVLEREMALKSVWLNDSHFNARSMDVYITKIRKLFADDSSVKIINIHGRGFKLIVK